MIDLSLVEPADHGAIRELLHEAFPTREESQLVDLLRQRDEVLFEAVARAHGDIVGHILFSPLPLRKRGLRVRGAALAPLSVYSHWRRKGIGGALVRMGIEMAAAKGIEAVVVLGDHAYYGKLGFSQATGRRIDTPFPKEYLQALEIKPGVLEGLGWKARYASAFDVSG